MTGKLQDNQSVHSVAIINNYYETVLHTRVKNLQIIWKRGQSSISHNLSA
jgi:hypothetical protein